MPAGRPRTPTKVLQLRGTHRRDRHGNPEDEPQFALLTELPPAPKVFDVVAAREWDRAGRELIEKQMLSRVSLAMFALYCLNFARAYACEWVIKERGMTLTTPQGFEQQRPEVSISKQCGAAALRFAQEFGITPVAQTRVRVSTKPAPKVDDPWAEVVG